MDPHATRNARHLDMSSLCLEMRLVKLHGLQELPRNNRYAICLGRNDENRYNVVIMGDICIFSLAAVNINFLPELKGFTFCENIKTLKNHQIRIADPWKDIYIDPDSEFVMGGVLGINVLGVKRRCQAVPDRLLYGMLTPHKTIEFAFVTVDSPEFAVVSTDFLLHCWENDDMPYYDKEAPRHFALGYCSEFYQRN
jgi:hypothetical protein